MKKQQMISLGEKCSLYISSKKLTEKQKELLRIILEYKKKHNCI